MTEQEIQLVQTSFTGFSGRKSKLARRFYKNLFDAAPSVKPLFSSDRATQEQKFADTLEYVITNLHETSAILQPIIDLAERHVGYGAAPEHYDVVGEVLLKSLAQEAQDDWTPDIDIAWTKAYNMLAKLMISTAYKHQARTA